MFHAHACAPAWGEDDQIAYAHYVRFNSGTGGYTARIVVQHGLGGPGLVWTGDGMWTNLVWAGRDLLANNEVRSSLGPALVILDGSGQQRKVDGQPGGRGPFFTVVAINPQGTEALLDDERLGASGSATSSPEDLAALLRIGDDKILSTARITADEQRINNFDALSPDGSWRGNTVIATDGVFLGGSNHPPATLATLSVSANSVRLRSIRQFLEHGYQPPGQNLDQLSQPRFLDASERHIAVWFDAIGQLEYLACDTTSGRCTHSPNYDATQETYARFVSNPSRP